ncbi:MAG: elongation factor P [Alphaproteobacteria bacterium]|nr:elongation factor P [Alphaproteobacteria bacterium]
MKVQANTIRPGNVIEHEGRRWIVINYELILPGKGNAFIAIEMRDVNTGTKTNTRYRTGDTVERLMTDSRECQFLFADGDNLTFMDNETFDQFIIPADLVGEPAVFLQEGMTLVVTLVEGSAIGVEMPKSVTLAIVEADPVVKGQTASSSYKPAVLENGVRIMVPPHIASGTRVVVNPTDRTYVERAKD